MRELGLTLPSEVQWEYAARAGGELPWSTGADARSLAGFANLVDAQGAEGDGWSSHAPVGTFAPNPFGLFDVHGNVSEWCRDSGEAEYEPSLYFGTGERQAGDEGSHTARGGDYEHGALWARSAARRQFGEHYQRSWVGLRPSREIDP
jgi:formylglycine-generating enzyme required for sulfatase activity